MTLILLFLFYLLLTNPSIIATEVYEASKLWMSVLLPTMYPSFVFIDLIENMPLINQLCNFLYYPFKFLFHIHSKKSSFLILISILCGSPASTKLFQASLEKDEISKKEYQNLICAFSTLSFPYTLFLCKQFFISVLAYYGLYLFLAILWMHLFNKKDEEKKQKPLEPISILKTLFSSIQKNIQIVLQILGILIIFRVFIKILFQNDPVLYPFLEILGGLQNTNNTLIALLSMGFLGFSEHLQVLSIADNLSYPKFLFARSYFMLLGVLVFL